MPHKKIPKKTATGRTPLTGTVPQALNFRYKGPVHYSKSSPEIIDTEMIEAPPLKSNDKNKKKSSSHNAKPMDIDGGKSKKRNNKN